VSDDDEQQGSGSQGEQGDPEASGDHDSEDPGSSGGPTLDRPNDIVKDLREGEQQDRRHR